MNLKVDESVKKTDEKMLSDGDIIDALVYAYAECVLKKNAIPRYYSGTRGAAYAIGILGGYILGGDYEERLKNIPKEAKKYLKQEADSNDFTGVGDEE